MEAKALARVAMLMPLHDPRGALAAQVDAVRRSPASWRTWQELRGRVGDAVALADPVASATREAFESLGVRFQARHDGSRSWMWTLADAALDLDAQHYFLPDPDRLLHWLLAYPQELAELPSRWCRHDVLSLTRSPRALESHPATQRWTEGPTIQLVGKAVGLIGADPFSGAYMLSRRALEAIVASPAPRDFSFYVEVFLAPARAGCAFGEWVVEGLEWETPDLFRAEIATLGWDGWLAEFQSADQWEKRVRMMALWIDRLVAHAALLRADA